MVNRRDERSRLFGRQCDDGGIEWAGRKAFALDMPFATIATEGDHPSGRTQVRQRADELADFVSKARRTYGLTAPVAIGFSNGANIAAVLLALHPDALAGAVLLRHMTVLDEPGLPLAATSVLMVSGFQGHIVPPGSARILAGRLRDAGAVVDHEVIRDGHGLTRIDLELAKAWGEGQPVFQAP